MSDYNLILDVDSYKSSHYLQYPRDITYAHSYIESRGGKYPSTVFFGLQYILKKYLTKPITKEHVYEAKAFFEAHGVPFNTSGWLYLVEKHKGVLPIRISAVDEGSLVPTGTPLVTIESTDPEFTWVVSYVETFLLRIWYPITVATQSYYCRKSIEEYLNKSSDDPKGEILFKLHDFGARGVSSYESAAIGGMAHLVNFMGSDTVSGVLAANKYYKHEMAAFSIPAAEHSTMTSWGKDGELAAYSNMIDSFAKPGALYAVVSDSYDINHAIDKLWGEALRDKILASGATIVIRPDSGVPQEVVPTLMTKLDVKFGHTLNSKGFKVLNKVRMIHGDNINQDSIKATLEAITALGYSATNLAFGMGGALLQQVDRDTQKFAYKLSAIKKTASGDLIIPVYKDPVDAPWKKSKSGVFTKNLNRVYDQGLVGSTTDLETIRKKLHG